MANSPTANQTQTHTPNSGGAQQPLGMYLLILESESYRRYDLTEYREYIIGREAKNDICLAHTAASRNHARLVVGPHETFIEDKQSHNGTYVNGERIIGPQWLLSGDIIKIGEVEIVFQRSQTAPSPRPFGGAAQLLQRSEEEVARALRFNYSLAVICFDFHEKISGTLDRGSISVSVSQFLRVIDYGAWRTTSQLVLLLPDLQPEEVHGLITDIAKALPSAAAVTGTGFSMCPRDGRDRDTLLNAAEQAARVTQKSEIGDASRAHNVYQFADCRVVVADPGMVKVYETARALAQTDISVLVTGETGTGKELVAMALHYGSQRAKRGRFIAQNCANMPDQLLDDILFGHERGAFTDAKNSRPGLFEVAEGGTLFLDEIAELSMPAQAKLLRVLDRKEITRLGSTRPAVVVDVRVVAATNHDLQLAINEGRFRRDLFQRLSPPNIVLKPLRDRPREIPILAREFLRSECQRRGIAEKRLSDATIERFLSYRWPGNVRELRRVIEDVTARVPGRVVDSWDLAPYLRNEPDPGASSDDLEPREPSAHPDAAASRDTPGTRSFLPIERQVQELEQRQMQDALTAAGQVIAKAARLISMPERTFYKKMRLYGISPGKR